MKLSAFFWLCLGLGYPVAGMWVGKAKHFVGHRLNIDTVQKVCEQWQGIHQCPKEHITNLCEKVPEICHGGEYIRCEMPQLPASPAPGEPASEEWQAWVESLNTSGIAVNLNMSMSIGDLISYHSSQIELDACKVCQMYHSARKCIAGKKTLPSADDCQAQTDGCFCAWASTIAVSTAEHKIVDGHHRWAATRFLVLDTGTFDNVSVKAGVEFLNSTLVAESYNASVKKLQRLGRSTKSVEHSQCGLYASLQSSANNMAMPMLSILLGLVSIALMSPEH